MKELEELEELEELKERIADLEHRLATVETIQHTHSRKHRMLETGKTIDEIIEDENTLTELLEKGLENIEGDDK